MERLQIHAITKNSERHKCQGRLPLPTGPACLVCTKERRTLENWVLVYQVILISTSAPAENSYRNLSPGTWCTWCTAVDWCVYFLGSTHKGLQVKSVVSSQSQPHTVRVHTCSGPCHMFSPARLSIPYGSPAPCARLQPCAHLQLCVIQAAGTVTISPLQRTSLRSSTHHVDSICETESSNYARCFLRQWEINLPRFQVFATLVTFPGLQLPEAC